MAAVFNASGRSLSCAVKPPGGRTEFCFVFLFFFNEGECPADTKTFRKCVGSIMKLDQKSKVKKS